MNDFKFVLVGFAVYWVSGIFSKGMFEKIQARQGSALFGLFNRKIQSLDRRVAESRTQIDDILLGDFPDALDRIDEIINPPNLQGSDLKYYQQNLDQSYSLSVLNQKHIKEDS